MDINQELSIIETYFQYNFQNKELLLLALTHRSFVPNNQAKHQHNERLEFLGDAVLQLVISDYLYKNFPSSKEGDLSKLRASIVNRKYLASIAEKLGINELVLIGNSLKSDKFWAGNISLLANTLEAVLGALFLDGGFHIVQNIIYDLFGDTFSQMKLTQSEMLKDYKTILQEKTTKLYGKCPEYSVVKSLGPPHNREYHILAFLSDDLNAVGIGKRKKEASQNAAKDILSRIESTLSE